MKVLSLKIFESSRVEGKKDAGIGDLQSGRLRQAKLRSAQLQILPGTRILEACSLQCDWRLYLPISISSLGDRFNCFAKFMIDAHLFHACFSWYNHFLSSPRKHTFSTADTGNQSCALTQGRTSILFFEIYDATMV